MSENRLMDVENGGTPIPQSDYRNKQPDAFNKKWKFLIVLTLVIGVTCLIGLYILLVKVDALSETRGCTCPSARKVEADVPRQDSGEPRVDDNEYYPGKGGDYDDDDNNPITDNVNRVKRSSPNGQIQIRESTDIEEDENGDEDVRVDLEVLFNEDSRTSRRNGNRKTMASRTDCTQCASLQEQEEMVRDLVAEVIESHTEIKIRHRRTTKESRRDRRRRERRGKNRNRRNSTPTAPNTTAQSTTTTHTVQPTPRLPLLHMVGKDVESEDPIMTLASTECPGCRVYEHFILDRYNRSKPKPDQMYKHWEVNETISDSSIAQMRDGVVTIKKSGIYLVYAQVVFYNSLPRNGLALKVNGAEKMRCMQHGPKLPQGGTSSEDESPTTPATTPYDNAIFSTCNPMQPMFLSEYDNLTLTSLYPNSWTYFNPLTSNWGIIMLSDVLPVNPTSAPTTSP